MPNIIWKKSILKFKMATQGTSTRNFSPPFTFFTAIFGLINISIANILRSLGSSKAKIHIQAKIPHLKWQPFWNLDGGHFWNLRWPPKERTTNGNFHAPILSIINRVLPPFWALYEAHELRYSLKYVENGGILKSRWRPFWNLRWSPKEQQKLTFHVLLLHPLAS